MIQVTQSEAMHLASLGLKWGQDLHRTNSNRHTYYVTERDLVIKQLNKFRQDKKEN